MFEGWQFCSPFVHKDDYYSFRNLKTHIIWCEKPKKFAACLHMPDTLEKMLVDLLIT